MGTAIEGGGGHVIRSKGEGAFAVFDGASDVLVAAGMAQRALLAEP
jgi:hypothetical protein